MSKKKRDAFKDSKESWPLGGTFSKCCWSDSSLAAVLCWKKDGLSGPFTLRVFVVQDSPRLV